MYEIELKVRLRVRDDDTTWIFDWVKSCLDLEESVEIETVKEEFYIASN